MEQQATIVKKYIRYLKLERNLSANTLEAYQQDIEKLLTFLDREEKHVLDVQLEDLQTFAAGLHDIGIGPEVAMPHPEWRALVFPFPDDGRLSRRRSDGTAGVANAG